MSFIFPFLSLFQGLDEEALVDHGKTSFTTHTNYEKEDLESKFKATRTEQSFLWMCFYVFVLMYICICLSNGKVPYTRTHEVEKSVSLQEFLLFHLQNKLHFYSV